jgi:hypothetical protein
MNQKMTGTDIVLVICSEPYYRRYHLEEKNGLGKGVTFESGMLSRRVLEAQGSEHGVIPVLFAREDIRWIPEFLRDETYYVLPEHFERLYRALTRQPLFVKPPLGQIKPLASGGPNKSEASPSAASPASNEKDAVRMALDYWVPKLVAFRSSSGDMAIGLYSELVRDKGSITISLVFLNDEAAADLAHLRNYSDTLVVAWGLYAAIVRVRSYREAYRDEEHIGELKLVEPPRWLVSWPEVDFKGITADDIALRRARRILLNEPLAPPADFSMVGTDKEKLERHVSGETTSGFRILQSVIPSAVLVGESEPMTLAMIRLICTMHLLMTNTVERITKFDVQSVPGGIAVDFVGVRARQGRNVNPTVIKVSGVCAVERPAAEI